MAVAAGMAVLMVGTAAVVAGAPADAGLGAAGSSGRGE
jgi:hypothetical protein